MPGRAARPSPAAPVRAPASSAPRTAAVAPGPALLPTIRSPARSQTQSAVRPRPAASPASPQTPLSSSAGPGCPAGLSPLGVRPCCFASQSSSASSVLNASPLQRAKPAHRSRYTWTSPSISSREPGRAPTWASVICMRRSISQPARFRQPRHPGARPSLFIFGIFASMSPLFRISTPQPHHQVQT